MAIKVRFVTPEGITLCSYAMHPTFIQDANSVPEYLTSRFCCLSLGHTSYHAYDQKSYEGAQPEGEPSGI